MGESAEIAEHSYSDLVENYQVLDLEPRGCHLLHSLFAKDVKGQTTDMTGKMRWLLDRSKAPWTIAGIIRLHVRWTHVDVSTQLHIPVDLQTGTVALKVLPPKLVLKQ